MNEDAKVLLRAWVADGEPDEWHLAPALADALEKSGWGDHKKLEALRNCAMRYTPYRYEIPIFDPEDIEIACGIPDCLRGYDWSEAFAYAGGGGYGNHNVSAALPGDTSVSVAPFGRRDVAEVLALSEGENDGANWLCVGRLKDGRWFALDAGCDYTGWD